MRVAALYDVHGNMPALEAVLAEVEREHVDAIVCGGDVAAGPMPADALERLRAAGARFVRGNADRELGGWPAERLSDDQLRFLRSLPLRLTLDVDGLGHVLFCHATPRSDEEIVTRLTPDDELASVLEDVPEPTIVCGHVHVQYDRMLAGHRVVNAGSVGLPYEGRPGAFWALLGPDVELRETAYDVEAAAALLRDTGYPEIDDVLASSLLQPLGSDEVSRHFEDMRGA
jgi:predicted phosphodiesterase